jgi:thioredoxin-related protein
MFRSIFSIATIVILSIWVSTSAFQPKPVKAPAAKTTTNKPPAKKTAAVKKPTNAVPVKTSSSEKVETVTKNKITWYNMTEGYKKAVKENKILIIDSYTDWCYWCKVMDKQTFGDSSIIQKMNEYAVAVKFNPEVNGEHIINGEPMNSNQLLQFLNRGGRNAGYPTIFIWKELSNNNKIDAHPGYSEPTQFNALINKYINQ